MSGWYAPLLEWRPIFGGPRDTPLGCVAETPRSFHRTPEDSDQFQLGWSGRKRWRRRLDRESAWENSRPEWFPATSLRGTGRQLNREKRECPESNSRYPAVQCSKVDSSRFSRCLGIIP